MILLIYLLLLLLLKKYSINEFRKSNSTMGYRG